MRTLTFPISKAAHKRFSLLEKNERLPMPITPEQTAPFGYRFSGPFLCLTHDGRDVAYVSDGFTADGKSVKVMTPMPESPILDAAIARTLTRITEHLNAVNRILSREDRERKEAEAAAAARRAEEARNAPDPLAQYRGEDTGGRVPHITRDDLRLLTYADTAKRSGFYISARPEGVYRLGSNGKDTVLHARADGDGDGVIFGDNPEGLSAERVGAHLAEIAAWARRNNDPALIAKALDALPPAEFSILSYALRPVRPGHKVVTQVLELPHGVAVHSSAHGIDLKRDGALVAKYRVPHQYGISDIRMVSDASECVTSNSLHNPVYRANIAGVRTDYLHRLGSVWIAAMAQADPEFDAAPYAFADFDRVIADAERQDAGYGF